ncbi:DUF4142 domain-containing protein [Pseudomonas sp. Gutcm_11s]|uniref:DUF4142 domain-containing protein n=1 Tax=Pseudomonas sp. Gutcm_11s TaxID=3026088 RepID=UPI002360797D|nr:DUF4142 domain-containing protein [Pseudomonas sp. Gutcm_11s]MDD0843537.1 DUF4142 domain-containing protein [Pseudomonas sp. Gutcm_11s]
MSISTISRGATLCLLLFTAPIALASDVDVKHFIEQAATVSATTTEAATLALRTSNSADIKDFAQRIIDDHPRGNADLQAFARERKLELPADQELQQRASAELKPLRGKDFDTRFAELQVRSFEQGLALFEQAAERGDDELQAFARAKLPVLKHQLQNARMLTRAHPAS